jgi:membrane protein DedA with SNARE-associated domain
MRWYLASLSHNINKLALAWSVQLYEQELKHGGFKMKNANYSKKMTYIGAGCGVVLFAVFGLLPGSFLGGVMGLNFAGMLLGVPVTSGVLSRLIVAASMVLGVMVSGIMFITGSSLAGWLLGTVADALTTGNKELATVNHK